MTEIMSPTCNVDTSVSQLVIVRGGVIRHPAMEGIRIKGAIQYNFVRTIEGKFFL